MTNERQNDTHVPRPLRVAVLTRTGRASGIRFANVVELGPHVLVAVIAERRSTMILRSLRKTSLPALVRKYGAPMIVAKVLGLVRSGLAKGKQRTSSTASASDHQRQFDQSKYHVVRDLNATSTVDMLKTYGLDLILVANAPILKSRVFSCAGIGAVNFHSGHLPAYGGVASEFWALYDRCKTSWVTFHWVTKKLDSGGILAESEISIDAGESPDSLYEKGVACACGILPELLEKVALGIVEPLRIPGPAIVRPWPNQAQLRALRNRE